MFPPLASGAALWISFPQFSIFPLAWVALIPYLRFLVEKRPWKQVLAGHFLMAGAYFGGVLYWIPRVLEVHGGLHWLVSLAVYVLMIASLGVFLLPFSLMTRWTAERSVRVALLTAPGFWVLTELLRNYYAVNGFPWALLGYSQYPYNWLIQIADLGGVYLISWVVVIANCALLGAFLFGSWRPIMFLLALLGLTNLYGAYRLYFWRPAESPSLRVALVQGNIDLMAGREHYASKYFVTLADYYRRAAQQGAQWVIFPEAQNPYFFQHDFYYRTFWQRLVDRFDAYLLFNNTLETTTSHPQYFNSALLLDPQGEMVYRYAKIHLVPFGEYVPMKEWLGFIDPLVQEVGAFSAGKSFALGSVNETRFATLICYEGIFPELSRRFVQEGAQMFVNITNDGWYGRTAAPEQHLEIAVFRAVENRKPFLRAANTGYTATIDPWGRIQQRLGLFQEGLLTEQVAGNSYRSVYSYIGEWLNISIIIMTFVLPLAAGKENRNAGRASNKI